MVLSGAISPAIWVVATVILLMTLLVTTHEPPSGKCCRFGSSDLQSPDTTEALETGIIGAGFGHSYTALYYLVNGVLCNKDPA